MEIDGALSDGKMGISVAGIVMQMNFLELISKLFQPDKQGGFGKAVLVSNIQAETKIGRWKLCEQLLVELRVFLPDILQQQRDFQDLGPFQQRLPGGQAAVQKAAPLAPVVVRIIAGVADHLNGMEQHQQVKELLQPGARHLPDERIGTPGTEVPKGAVK
jgi:hypothetical protein